MSGSGIPGAIFGGDGINVSPENVISLGETQEVSSVSFDNIGSEIVARFPIPEDTTMSFLVELTGRLFRAAATSAAGSGAAYLFHAAAGRLADADAVLVAAATALSALESASGTLPADWSATVGVDGTDLVVTFTIANNSYAEGSTPNIGLSAKFVEMGRVTTPAT